MERKNRDEFRRLMEEHVVSGILTTSTHWRDYCMKVSLPTWFLYYMGTMVVLNLMADSSVVMYSFVYCLLLL